MKWLPQSFASETAFVVCIGISYFLIKLISKKIDAYREKRIQKGRDRTRPNATLSL
jgi:hypothetical protein